MLCRTRARDSLPSFVLAGQQATLEDLVRADSKTLCLGQRHQQILGLAIEQGVTRLEHHRAREVMTIAQVQDFRELIRIEV